MNELLNEDQVAQLLHSNKRYVQDLRRANKIHGAKFGKHWLYQREDIERFINEMFDLAKKREG